MKPEEIDQLPAGPELDALVHKYILGEDPIPKRIEQIEIISPYKEIREVLTDSPLPFSTNINAALWLLDKIKMFQPRRYSNIYMRIPAGEGCDIWWEDYIKKELLIFASGKTIPMGICKLALKTAIQDKA